MRIKILNNKRQLQIDREKLRKLGYIQELNRSMGVISNASLSFSVISILTGLITLYGVTTANMGAYEIRSWTLVGIFQLMMSMCLGEISSCYPIAGGVYKWTSILGNNIIGWFNGWISLLGWIACTAGINYGLSKFILESFTGAKANSLNLNLIVIIIILFQTFISSFGIKLISKINNLSVIIHIAGVLAITILILVFTNGSGLLNHMHIIFNPLKGGWQNYIQSLLMSAWTLTAFDASASISEESINPTKTVPYGMILSVAVSFVFGWLLLFSLGYAESSIMVNKLQGTTVSLYIIKTTLGPTVTKFISLIMIVAMFVCGLACQTVTVRIIYALSRDKGMPLSNLWKNVGDSYGTPLFSIALCGALEFIICAAASAIVYVFSKGTASIGIPTRTLPIITSLSTIGIYSSYAIVSFCALINRKKIKLDQGEFSLGKSGTCINLLSFVWSAAVALVLLFYFNSQTTAVFFVFLICLILYYLLSVRKEIINNKTLTEKELIEIENMRRWRDDEQK